MYVVTNVHTINMITYVVQFPGNKAEKQDKWEIPALMQIKVWLGLDKHEAEWHKMQPEGELAVLAESVDFILIQNMGLIIFSKGLWVTILKYRNKLPVCELDLEKVLLQFF